MSGKSKYLPEFRETVLGDVIMRFENGEDQDSVIQEVSGVYDVPVRTINFWLQKEGIATELRQASYVADLRDVEKLISGAENDFELRKALGLARFKQWGAERRASELYGTKQEVTHKLPNGPLLSITLSVPAGDNSKLLAPHGNDLISTSYAVIGSEAAAPALRSAVDVYPEKYDHARN